MQIESHMSSTCRIHFMFFFFSLPARATYWRLPGSRLYVLVSTRRAMHPIQRCLLASARGWRTIFCLRSEGEHTYTHFLQGKKKKKPAARQTYIAFGSVVAVYFFLSLLLYDMFTKYLFRMRRWLRRALPFPVPEDARR